MQTVNAGVNLRPRFGQYPNPKWEMQHHAIRQTAEIIEESRQLRGKIRLKREQLLSEIERAKDLHELGWCLAFAYPKDRVAPIKFRL